MQGVQSHEDQDLRHVQSCVDRTGIAHSNMHIFIIVSVKAEPVSVGAAWRPPSTFHHFWAAQTQDTACTVNCTTSVNAMACPSQQSPVGFVVDLVEIDAALSGCKAYHEPLSPSPDQNNTH